jgi:GPN-loop GTPase
MSSFADKEGHNSTDEVSISSNDLPSFHRTSPMVVLIIGMAGAGKSTLLHRINLHMNASSKKGYYINLDPAVKSVPYAANIDIRDTVNYKQVMEQYGLGPNGGILTSLNLFSTRFDQVVKLLEKRADSLDYIFIDTPGQIEVFTWSAGGQIISELLGTTFPTCILYVTDTPRCTSPTTFMSNMLYASSIMFKTFLPVICTFNKNDIVPANFAKEWMEDFEAYQEAVDADNQENYVGPLNRSLSLALEEFYKNIMSVSVSALNGDGIQEMFDSIDKAAVEFKEMFIPEMQRRMALKEVASEAAKEKEMEKLRKDLSNL